MPGPNTLRSLPRLGMGRPRWLVAVLVAWFVASLGFPALAADAAPGAPHFSGTVFLDANGNGRRDPGEQGVAGVKLSNGRDIVPSDADGHYRIAVQPGDTVFAVKPPGHAFNGRADGMPAFWQHYFPAGSPDLKYGGIPVIDSLTMDVALLPAAATADALEVLLVADPQVKSMADVGYYNGDILATVRVDAPA